MIKRTDLRTKGIAYVERYFGKEAVAAFTYWYDGLNSGIPCGGLAETMAFCDLIEKIKAWDYKKVLKDEKKAKRNRRGKKDD